MQAKERLQARAAAPESVGPFKLLRYASIAGFVVVLVVGILLALFYERLATHFLVELGESNDTVLATSITNALEAAIGDDLDKLRGLSPAALHRDPAIERIREAVRNQTQGLNVVKLSILGPEGRILFSTTVDDIGREIAFDAGLLAAWTDRVVSDIVEQAASGSSERSGPPLRMLRSLAPIASNDGPVAAVVEIVSDIAHVRSAINRSRAKVIGGVIGLLELLYITLFFIIRHADRLIKRQHQGLAAREADLRTKANALEAEIGVRRETETALRRAKENAELANRAKSNFLAHMSHELRTPLNAILGFSEMIKERVFDAQHERYVEYARLIHDSGSHLLRIIGDILDLSKIESDNMSLNPVKLDIREAVESVALVLGGVFDENEIVFVANVPDDCPPLVADARAVKQMLVNLLTNAAKFSPAGGRVEVQAVPEVDGGMLVRVVDTGIGVPEDKIPLAFEPFRQVGADLAVKGEGTGLGLPLVKSLIELHGGAIALESTVGEGTTVSLWFPNPIETVRHTGSDPAQPAA